MKTWEEINNCKHKFYWDGEKYPIAVCAECHVIDTDIKEKDCIGYVDPIILEAERKAKRLVERERKKQATIAWLQNAK